jgi:polyisoprenoid-binding protein YceI
MMVSKVRGHFGSVEGTIVTGEDVRDSSVEARVDVSSIDTNNEQRDAHIRSADFFEVEKFPVATFRSAGVRGDRDGYVLAGELNLHGVTRPVQLELEFNGVTKDPWGGTRAGFSGRTEINRKDFGIDIELPMDGGGVVVGDKIQLNLEIEAVLQQG